MADETTTMPDLPPTLPTMPSGESQIFGVSIRAWLAVMVVLTVCLMSFLKMDVKEPLYSLVLLSSGYYFGASGKNSGTNGAIPK